MHKKGWSSCASQCGSNFFSDQSGFTHSRYNHLAFTSKNSLHRFFKIIGQLFNKMLYCRSFGINGIDSTLSNRIHIFYSIKFLPLLKGNSSNRIL